MGISRGEIIVENNEVVFTIPEFLTHVQLSKKVREKKVETKVYNKKTGHFETRIEIANSSTAGKPKYTKINGQSMYNGSWNDFTKGKVVDTMKEFLSEVFIEQEKFVDRAKNYLIGKRIEASLQVFTIKNHDRIQIRGGNLILPKNDSKPTWDIFNFGMIWMKVLDDFMVEKGVIVDDSIDYLVSSGKTTFVEIEDFNKRYLLYRLKIV